MSIVVGLDSERASSRLWRNIVDPLQLCAGNPFVSNINLFPVFHTYTLFHGSRDPRRRTACLRLHAVRQTASVLLAASRRRQWLHVG